MLATVDVGDKSAELGQVSDTCILGCTPWTGSGQRCWAMLCTTLSIQHVLLLLLLLFSFFC